MGLTPNRGAPVCALHLSDQKGQIGCSHIEDTGIVREFAVHIAHHLVGAVLCPVEHNALVRADAAFELIVSDEGPLWKLLPEFLCHVGMPTQKQNTLLGKNHVGRFASHNEPSVL